MGAAWSGVGYGIFVTWLALIALSVKTENWSWMAVMPTTVLVAIALVPGIILMRQEPSEIV